MFSWNRIETKVIEREKWIHCPVASSKRNNCVKVEKKTILRAVDFYDNILWLSMIL